MGFPVMICQLSMCIAISLWTMCAWGRTCNTWNTGNTCMLHTCCADGMQVAYWSHLRFASSFTCPIHPVSLVVPETLCVAKQRRDAVPPLRLVHKAGTSRHIPAFTYMTHATSTA